jgi:hypothetical protein
MTAAEAMAEHMADPERRAWIETRPPAVRAVIERIPPMTWWRQKSGGAGIYTPVSYEEQKDGRITVRVYKHDFLVPILAYEVFGCNPDDFVWTELTPENTLEDFFKAWEDWKRDDA